MMVDHAMVASNFMDGATVVENARAWIGTPYRHQASCKGAGTDCLGLIRGLYRELYGHEPEIPPPYSAAWAETSPHAPREMMFQAARRHLIEIDTADARPGDVLLFRMRQEQPMKHAAIQSRASCMIHAYARHCVAETSIGPWWQARLAAAFRYPSKAVPHALR